METQVDLVLGICGLYNFIREHEDISQELEDIEVEEEEDPEEVREAIDIRGGGNKYMNEKREAIAQQMWKDYQEYINNNNLII
jgi:hypothetical protein